MAKYQLTKTDNKEMKALLTFLSGIFKDKPIKKIAFEKGKTRDLLILQRFDSESENEFSEFTLKINKIQPPKKSTS